MYEVVELGGDEVDALHRRLGQLGHLLLDDGLEGNVGREQTAANTVRVLDGERDLAPQLLLVKLHLAIYI